MDGVFEGVDLIKEEFWKSEAEAIIISINSGHSTVGWVKEVPGNFALLSRVSGVTETPVKTCTTRLVDEFVNSTTGAVIADMVAFTVHWLSPSLKMTMLTFHGDRFVRQPLGDRLRCTMSTWREWSDLIELVCNDIGDLVRECLDGVGRWRKKVLTLEEQPLTMQEWPSWCCEMSIRCCESTDGWKSY